MKPIEGVVLRDPDVNKSDIASIVEKSLKGEKLNVDDIYALLKSDELWVLGKVATTIKRVLHSDICTYIKNMILNYTNICIIKCKFCAFYRDINDGYTMSIEEAVKKVYAYWQKYGIRQVLIQGGVNPLLGIEYYEDLFKSIKRVTRNRVAIHALSPVEIDYLSKKYKMSYRELLSRLKDSGMDSLPGGGAELLIERVRRILSPNKISTETWLRIVEEAHKLNIPTSVTMMYGHIETVYERAIHLYRLYELNERVPGSLAFIAWNFEPNNTELSREFEIKYPYGGYELLRIISTARITFREVIPNIQAGWLTVGERVAQLSFKFGANDWGGTLYEEKVIPSTGLRIQIPTTQRIENLIKEVGCTPKERDNWYRIVD
ncbi:radical SAM protein [Ignicoccus islandicus DSM 13165]|uniref:Radical SAM protein n=1 Tax=Ignicoccus islandicus DSM 13165 TaxID=940295 RepID=A0A0U3FMQ7_9CREN|nr:CofH family radical SAM protein [Ignicoccus islandicus]ALU11663.1 radical SAM protein [Ignicoccus islandicus DSM 13165]